MADNLADKIREKLHTGRLPHDDPRKIWAGYGTARNTCDGCDLPILPAQVEYEMEFDGGRPRVFLHAACHGLWRAARRHRGLPPGIPPSASARVVEILHARALCLRCVAEASEMSPPTVRDLLHALGNHVRLEHSRPQRCDACGKKRPLFHLN